MKKWKPAVWIVLGLVTLFLATLATQCRADATASVEVGARILRYEDPAIGLTVTKPGVVKDADLEAGVILIAPRGRNEGVMGVRAEIVDGVGRLDVGIGAVYLNKPGPLNGSNLNFSLMLRYNFTDRWAVTVRHFSNAGTTPKNTGTDTVLISYRF